MLTFDSESHSYSLVGVGPVPSVTQILSDSGMMPYYPDREFYRKRGHAVHQACALLATGRLDLTKTDQRLHGYIQSFDLFLKRTGFKPELIEHPVWSKLYRAAGTLDYYGPLGGHPTIIDLKSGDPADAAALQTAAYAAMLKESCGKPTGRRLTLRLDPDGGEPKPEEYYEIANDIRIFFSATAVWHWRKNNRLVR